MSRFSESTLEAARFFVNTRRPVPYGPGRNRDWLFDLLGRHPDVLDAVVSHEGVALHGSSAASNRLIWNVLCDMRTDLLGSFLWKLRSQTPHKMVAVVSCDTLINPQVVNAVVNFTRQNTSEGKRNPPFKLREIVKRALQAPDPTPWCNAARQLMDGDFGLPKTKLGEWLAKDHYQSGSWGMEAKADDNAAALLDTFSEMGIRADLPQYRFLAAAAKEYAGHKEKRGGLISILIERGADWKTELARTDTMFVTREALAEHPLVKKMRLLDTVETQQMNPAVPRMKF